MDWEQVNVSFDPEVGRQLNEASSGWGLPWYIYFLLAFLAIGFVVYAKTKAKDKDKKSDSDKK